MGRLRAPIAALVVLAVMIGNCRADTGPGTTRLLPPLFEGVFIWNGRELQDVVLSIERQETDASGMLIAHGHEHYRAGTGFATIAIRIELDPRTLRFELFELPKPADFAQDTPVGIPFVGTISADFSTVINNVSEDTPVVQPDFILRAGIAQSMLARRD